MSRTVLGSVLTVLALWVIGLAALTAMQPPPQPSLGCRYVVPDGTLTLRQDPSGRHSVLVRSEARRGARC